jgi:hypothetical protein
VFPALAVLADGRVLVAVGNSSAVYEKPLASAEIGGRGYLPRRKRRRV